MVGVVLILLAIFVIGPVAIFFGGAIWSLATGWLWSEDADRRAAGDSGDSGAAQDSVSG